MSDPASYTVEQFLDARMELPDAGRWTELAQGQIINLDAPDIEHGTIVLNISKSLSRYLHKRDDGAAYFELGLVVKRDPDTVRFPAVCIFKTGSRFDELDKVITERRPDAIIEIASTNPRRRQMQEHVDEYVNWGVSLIWVIDPTEMEVLEYRPATGSEVIDINGKMTGGDSLPEFEMSVRDLFAEPDWW
ncbi:Uma2 family endonuclease [Gimesia panareensis]|uniref:Putative restriction endonuclease domain-containing protein n=1 Tax=Gimesia panareensis TaxID=2527978 RepID=A0A518ADQ0_9PLAN|nr:Uma2 family endonuclease [Gimesia panareensis]QDT29766.1 hypothetical protein Enr10x_51210 [Gimesia panareensis]QDU52843.1 hypothetical protein Pan110_52250 [Gimesia panareensis]QDV20786.1 hypothetical protein Pan153_54650 [Gimesia panareensis]